MVGVCGFTVVRSDQRPSLLHHSALSNTSGIYRWASILRPRPKNQLRVDSHGGTPASHTEEVEDWYLSVESDPRSCASFYPPLFAAWRSLPETGDDNADTTGGLRSHPIRVRPSLFWTVKTWLVSKYGFAVFAFCNATKLYWTNMNQLGITFIGYIQSIG